MRRFIGVGILLVLAVSGCVATRPTVTPTATLPPLPNSGLAQLLDLVPGDLASYSQSNSYSSLATYFVDRAGEAEAIGQIIPFSNSTYAELSTEQKRQLTEEKELLFVYGGPFVPLPAGLASGNFSGWKEGFGYEPMALRDSLYVGQPTNLNSGAALIEGNYPVGSVRLVLLKNKYTEIGTDYFGLPGDANQVRQDAVTQHVTGPTAMMNRLALGRDAIIAGSNEDLITAMHESLRQGSRADSLARTPAVTALVEGLGKVHFALVFSSRLLPEAQKGVSDRAPFTPPTEWGDLSGWTWATVAYTRDLPSRARFTIALGYPDAASAEQDRAELQKRLQTYRPMVLPEPQQQGDGRQEAPLTDACTLGEPKVQQRDDASALIISCTYDPTVHGAWWVPLVQTWDFNFLYAQKGNVAMQ